MLTVLKHPGRLLAVPGQTEQATSRKRKTLEAATGELDRRTSGLVAADTTQPRCDDRHRTQWSRPMACPAFMTASPYLLYGVQTLHIAARRYGTSPVRWSIDRIRLRLAVKSPPRGSASIGFPRSSFVTFPGRCAAPVCWCTPPLSGDPTSSFRFRRRLAEHQRGQHMLISCARTGPGSASLAWTQMMPRYQKKSWNLRHSGIRRCEDMAHDRVDGLLTGNISGAIPLGVGG